MAIPWPISAAFAAGMDLLIAAWSYDESGGGQESGPREHTAAATESEPATVVALGWARAALGAVIIALPGSLLGRLFPGKDPDPVAVAIARGFGARNIAVGAGIVWAHRSGDPEVERRWYLAAAGTDLIDALAMVLGRGLPKAHRAVGALAAGSATAAGVLAGLRAVDQEPTRR
jgi:hypothetical protein